MCELDSFGKIDAVYYLLSPYYNDVLRLILCESEQMLFIRHIIIRSFVELEEMGMKLIVEKRAREKEPSV